MTTADYKKVIENFAEYVNKPISYHGCGVRGNLVTKKGILVGVSANIRRHGERESVDAFGFRVKETSRGINCGDVVWICMADVVKL